MWERVVRESLPAIRVAVPPGSRVLEVGYGDGLLSCFMAREFGWHITGLDIRPAAADGARAAAKAAGLEDRVDFRVVRPEETRRHSGRYQAVFAKTVFYSSRSLEEYREWLDWVASVLLPGGVLVNYDTGKANALTQAYRRLRGREYTSLSLYTGEIERLYDERFTAVFRRYYGGISQFVAPLPGLYEAAAALESCLSRRTADNCFIVSMVARANGGTVKGAGS
jgi:ubiquinone/menaquinone biosynthesis C-methylase UbiE